MKYLLSILFFLYASSAYASPVLKLSTAGVCIFRINDREIDSAILYGNEEDLENFLARQESVFIKDCQWQALNRQSPGSVGTQAEFIIGKFAQEAQTIPTGIERYDIILITDSSEDFIDVFNTLPVSTGGNGDNGGNAGNPPSPPAPPAPLPFPEPSPSPSRTDALENDNSICDFGGEFCYSSNGSSSYGLTCGQLNISIVSEETDSLEISASLFSLD